VGDACGPRPFLVVQCELHARTDEEMVQQCVGDGPGDVFELRRREPTLCWGPALEYSIAMTGSIPKRRNQRSAILKTKLKSYLDVQGSHAHTP
jgi:hypothetical protein